MARFRAAGLAILGLTVTVPAAAQFGGIFGEPSRPPAPVGRQAPETLVPQPPLGQQELPPPAPLQPPLAQAPPGPPPSGAITAIESQPLPPPPGGTSSDQPQPTALPGGPSLGPPAQPPGPPGQPPGAPGQRPVRGGPQPPLPQQPTNTAPQSGDEVVTEMPTQKVANPKAVFSGLDKITGRITAFDVAIDETVQFGALRVRPRACYTRPPTETPNTDGFIEVDEVTLQGEIKRLFTGWMFAASPGLHGIEHPIYDVWLTDCKGATPAVADVQPAPTPPPARANPPRQPAAAQRQPRSAPPVAPRVQ